MDDQRSDRWRGRLRGTATVVSVAALCFAVALLVIGLLPGSPVSLELPATLVPGGGALAGIAPGTVIDPAGAILLEITDPSLPQRLLHLATTLPGLLLVAEIARRMASMLAAAQSSDPFTARTVRDLRTAAKITAFGGLAVWVIGNAAKWALSATVLDSGTAAEPHQTPLGWLAVGLLFAAFAQLVARGVVIRTELDTVI